MFGKKVNIYLLLFYTFVASVISFTFINSSYAMMEDSSQNQNPMSEEERIHSYHIVGCVRNIHTAEEKRKPAYKDCFNHCFIKLVNQQNNATVDSRGFFADVGSVQEPETFTGTCEMIKPNASLEDWQKVLEVYDKYKDEHYSTTSHNCCTVAKEASQTVANHTPKNIDSANSSIGTRWKPCNIQ